MKSYSYELTLTNDSSGTLDTVGGKSPAASLDKTVQHAVAAFARNITFRPGDTIRITFPDGHPDVETD